MLTSDNAYDLFVKIANTSGSSKQSLLRQYVPKEYLLAAYDPFTKYYMTKCAEGRGHKEFDELTWVILDKLSYRGLSGDEAKSIVNIHTMEMTEKSSNLFRMILNKDLRMGMGAKTINKVFPGLIPRHPIMLAKGFERNRAIYPCFGEPKYHGNRAVFDFKKQKFLSRSGHDIVGLDHLIEAMPAYCFDYDGELRDHGMSFQKSNGQINSDNPSPNAQYHVFALYDSGNPYFEDRMVLEDLDFEHPFINVVPNELINDYEEAIKYYSACVKASKQYKFKMFDGCILKTPRHKYQDRRCYDWMKIKDEESISLRVTGVYEGTKGKQFEGQLGGVYVFHKGVKVKVGGGFGNSDRKKYYDNPELIVGKIIDVLYQEVTDDGSLRDPIFDGIRYDKEEEDK